jgi:hypothetical protein
MSAKVSGVRRQNSVSGLRSLISDRNSTPLESNDDGGRFWATERVDLPKGFAFWRSDSAVSPPFTAFYRLTAAGGGEFPVSCFKFQVEQQSEPKRTADGLVRFRPCKTAQKNGFGRFRSVYARDNSTAKTRRREGAKMGLGLGKRL